MSPRAYNLEKRRAAVEQTRRRIVQATMDLHLRQGILATSYEDIAREADVALATVYRHFPALENLVEACGALTHRIICPPEPDDAPRLFYDVKTMRDRVSRLVGEFAAFYQRSAQAWQVVLRDCHRLAQLQAVRDQHRRTIEIFVREALRTAKPLEQTVQAVCALLDFPTWQSLVESGLDESGAREMLERWVLCSLQQSVKNTRRSRRGAM